MSIEKEKCLAGEKRLEEGDRMAFGSFRGRILNWRVLFLRKGEAMLLCENIPARLPYDGDHHDFLQSTLCAWLNDDFLKGFDDCERKRLRPLIRRGEKEDKPVVTLLTLKEACFFFDGEEAGNRTRLRDPFALAGESWWLSDCKEGKAYLAGSDGILAAEAKEKAAGVRPLICITL